MKSENYDLDLIDSAILTNRVSSKFLGANPYDPQSFASKYQQISSKGDFDRDYLSRTFCDYNLSLQCDSLTIDSCHRLSDPKSMAVVTGQQAGMFSGPLYTIYKIMTAINLAKYCESKFETPVIPIYWNATEDHDLSEIESFNYPDKQWRADFSEKGYAAQHLNVSPACTDLISDFIESIPEINHRNEVYDILSSNHNHYGKFSSSIISKLFKGTGLVVMEPELLRKISVSFLEECLNYRTATRDLLTITGEKLETAGIEPAFQVDDDATGLFYINNSGTRYRIREHNKTFQIEGEWISESSMNKLLNETPSSFSTGAYLRPVLQSQLIPTLSYVAGPGEYKYHLQLGPIFDQFNSVLPVIFPRNHATILTKREMKLAETLQMGPADFFKGPQSFYNGNELEEGQRQAFSNAGETIDAAADSLYREITHVVSNQQIDTFKSNLITVLNKFEKQAGREFQRKNKTDNARIDRFFNCVFPKNTLQERIINIFYFIESNGVSLIKELIDILEPFERQHYLLYTDN